MRQQATGNSPPSTPVAVEELFTPSLPPQTGEGGGNNLVSSDGGREGAAPHPASCILPEFYHSWGLCFLAVLLFAGCAASLPDRQVISTTSAPAAIGPYSQAVRAGHTLYLSGQIAIDPATGKVVEGGVEAQAHRVMQNLRAVLEAAGFSLDDAVQCQVFLKDLNDYAAVNGVYAGYFKGAPPARAVVQAARLPRDVLIEVMMTAVRTRK